MPRRRIRKAKVVGFASSNSAAPPFPATFQFDRPALIKGEIFVNTLEAIEQQRAVKHFDPHHRFTDSEIDTLLTSAMLSSTLFNIQNWRFVLVSDPELRPQPRPAQYLRPNRRYRWFNAKPRARHLSLQE